MARLRPQLLPTHVGVVMDGNRRWAKKAGFADALEVYAARRSLVG